MTTWTELLAEEKRQPYFSDCLHFVQQRRQQGIAVYPPKDKVFEAFRACDFDDIKVVILGQDPYHGPGQAHGLCFSVNKGVPSPPSLQNIFKELSDDLSIPVASHGDLSSWAAQGVFLLNTILTVERGQPKSHQNIGWERFTDHVLSLINEHRDHVVFMLWGSPAQAKQRLIDTRKHTLLKAPHPSPLSAYRGFFGCRHFSLANAALTQHNQTSVDWLLN